MLLRFDDARAGRRRGFMLTDVVEVVRADRLGDVPEVLDRVEQAVAAGHWVGGWVAYEAGPAFDPALAAAPTTGTPLADLPLAWFAVAAGRTRARPDLDAPPGSGVHLGQWRPAMDAPTHAAAVRRIHEHIAAGETYQVNLTYQLTTEFDGDPHDLYRQLATAQSGGFGACLDTGDWAVASASPELFFTWEDGLLTCRPMKGTTHRGVVRATDRERRQWLVDSDKNRAENVMIVDMVRNDLARVATRGGVAVPELFTTEKYDTVWQLTSTVTARTRPEVGLVDVFAALFPSASITGAPKVATSRIIRDLETGPRGVYCGAIGFGGPGPDGPSWTFNVGIRTVTVDRAAGTAHYGTGGGITIDSDPRDEHAEAQLKALVLGRQSSGLQLVETTRVDPVHGVRHRDLHVARVLASAEYFDVPLRRSALERALADVEAGVAGEERVRILVDRTGRPRVTRQPAPSAGRLAPGPAAHDATVAASLRLAVDDHRVDPTTVWLHHKTTNRAVYDAALARVGARGLDVDDVVLVNEAGNVTETTIGNLAVLVDGRWVTPPTADGLLEGTEREWRLAIGDLVEASVSVADLGRADAIARLNSVRGWQPAVLVA